MRDFVYLLVPVAVFAGVPAVRAEDAHPMPCVEVQIGQDSTSHMDCVNEALRRSVEHEHNAPLPEAPINAQSASNKVGTYNDAAARQMMGNAFGVSPIPQRPKVSFTNPLVPGVR